MPIACQAQSQEEDPAAEQGPRLEPILPTLGSGSTHRWVPIGLEVWLTRRLTHIRTHVWDQG